MFRRIWMCSVGIGLLAALAGAIQVVIREAAKIETTMKVYTDVRLLD